MHGKQGASYFTWPYMQWIGSAPGGHLSQSTLTAVGIEVNHLLHLHRLQPSRDSPFSLRWNSFTAAGLAVMRATMSQSANLAHKSVYL